MKHIPLTTLCVAISAVLLTACGGSGGSNPPAPTPIPNAGGAGNAGSGTGGAGSTDNAANAGSTGGASSGTGSASTPEPKYQDVPTEKNEKAEISGIQEPAMGYGMELKLRNWIPKQEEHAQISTDDVVKLEGGLEHKPFDNSIWQNIKNSKEVQNTYKQEKQHIEDQIRRENKQRPENERLDEAALEAYIKKALDDRLTSLAKPIYEKNINYSHDKQNKARTRDLTYVRSGYIYHSGYSKIDIPNKIAKTGFDGALFYKGEQTAKELPVSEVKYKGTWDFMTDAKDRQSFSSFNASPAGNRYSVMSSHEYSSLLTDERDKPNDYNGAYGHSSEFDVNFADKKIKGKLISNQLSGTTVTAKERYKIEANIHGNRFRGSAIASDKAEDSKTQHPFTSDATNKLEGGFYGPKGEELAGKFLTDDNKLFGVFGAKQEGNVEKTEAILDAYALGTFNKNDANTFTPFTEKQLDNFGNAKKLVLGSTVIDLVPTDATKYVNEFTKDKPDSATNKAGETLMVNDKVSVKTYGKNFEYLKFGELSVGTSNSVFLQGERTATTGEKAVPTTGKAKYLGNWVGYITGADSSKGFNDAKDVADFDIDFASKTVNGKLITKDRKDPVFNITGQIAGNGWTGKASTAEANAGGYKIDSSSTGKSIVIKDAEVTGGFYGPNATEMGGSFAHKNSGDDGKVSVVFGTKKQQEVKQ